MPVILQLKGYRFECYASDRDEPPHVHVKKDREAAKFWLEPIVSLETNHGYRPYELNKVQALVEGNREHCWRHGMRSLVAETELEVEATDVRVTDETITVDLEDGRTISVPTAWFPRLKHATLKERANYEIWNDGIVWPDIDADFSIQGLLLGRKSGESPESFKFWLDNRKKGRKVTFEDYMKTRRKQKPQAKTRK